MPANVLLISVGTSDPLNKGVYDVRFRRWVEWCDDDDEIVNCCDRPEYAPESSDEDEEEEVEFSLTKQQQVVKVSADVNQETKREAERDDRRLRRLQDRQHEEVDSDEDREARCAAVCVRLYC